MAATAQGEPNGSPVRSCSRNLDGTQARRSQAGSGKGAVGAGSRWQRHDSGGAARHPASSDCEGLDGDLPQRVLQPGLSREGVAADRGGGWPSGG